MYNSDRTSWQPVGPLGIAHAASEDDVYEGYFVPKGLSWVTLLAFLHVFNATWRCDHYGQHVVRDK